MSQDQLTETQLCKAFDHLDKLYQQLLYKIINRLTFAELRFPEWYSKHPDDSIYLQHRAADLKDGNNVFTILLAQSCGSHLDRIATYKIDQHPSNIILHNRYLYLFNRSMKIKTTKAKLEYKDCHVEVSKYVYPTNL